MHQVLFLHTIIQEKIERKKKKYWSIEKKKFFFSSSFFCFSSYV